MELEQLQREDTKHEPHEHARSRIFIGTGALIAVLLIGGIIWAYWGNDIEEACFGDGEVCNIELPGKV